MSYLVQTKTKDKPWTLEIVTQSELFKLLQDKTEGIAVYELPEFCVIDWS